MTCVPSYDLDLKLAELKINGYVIFEELFPVETIDRIRAAFIPLMEQVRAKARGLDPDLPRPERQVFIHGRSDERLVLQGQIQNLNRYTVYVPWEQPFADPAMYEHPVVLEFLERYWETTEYHVTCYHSNVPYPGSDHQGWHRDIPLLVPHVGLSTCPHLGLKIPLVDTCEENGSFEVMPCTQYGAHPEFHGRYDEVLEAGDFPNRRRLNLRKGTGWVQDPRAFHRGTPNRSDHPRPELVICYSLPWFAEHGVTMTRAEYARLSERGRELLTRCDVLD